MAALSLNPQRFLELALTDQLPLLQQTSQPERHMHRFEPNEPARLQVKGDLVSIERQA
jgi:hypothetical protein